MFNYQRFLVLLLVMLYCILHTLAFDTYVVVYAKDGTRNAYSLSEHPKVFFDSENVLLKTDDIQIKYPIAKMRIIAFEDPTSLSFLSKNQIGYTIHDNYISLEGLRVGDYVMVYNLAGMLCSSYIVGSDGCLDISLDTLPTNIYIVKTGDTTIKIQKK